MKRFSLFLLSFLFLTSIAHPAITYAYTTGMNASVVIGQSDFTSGSVNQAGSVRANTLSDPHGLIVYGGKLILADRNNHRVLIFNQVPTTNNASADLVIGQQNLTSGSANQGGSVNANTFNIPTRVNIIGGKLFITDNANNRILIFNQVPTTNNTSADVVIGQQDFTHNSVNQGGSVNSNTLSGPGAVAYDEDSGKFFVADSGNNRILIFNKIPTTNNASADLVIGQQDLTHNSVNQGITRAANTISGAFGVRIYNGKLFIGDYGNLRLLIFNGIPATNNMSADVVVGQADFASAVDPYASGTSTARTTGSVNDVFFDGKRLFVETGHCHRILIFNGIPTQNYPAAYMAIGKTDFSPATCQNFPASQSNLYATSGGIDIYNNQLIFSDRSYNRVMIFYNVTDTPSLSLSNTITSGTDGKLRFNGTTTTNTSSTYIPTNVDYSVNRGNYQSATAKDGSFDSVREDYYFDFTPSDNNYKGEGYTVKVRTRNSNLDQTDNAFFFQPFSLNTPITNASSSTGLPSVSFNVNKDLFSELKDTLSKFQVMTKRSGEDWRTYLDNIPVSYENNKDNSDNVYTPKGTDGKGNGTYESKKLTVVYSNDNATISFTPKPVDSDGNTTSKLFPENSQRLASGVYEWKVVAVDKVGHTQETETRMLKVSGANTTGTGTTGVYFPLSLLSLSTSSINNISTNYPQGIKASYTAFTTTPTLKGIAFANSTITLNTTDTSCITVLNPNDPNCMKTQTTVTGADSRFSMTIPAKTLLFGKKYTTSLSVGKDGQFNALPDFTLSVVASQEKK